MATPKGMTAIMHWPDGDVIASVSDFDRSGYGGFTLAEAQRMRALDAVKRESVRKMCHDDIAACMSSSHISELVGALIREKGYSISVIPIGHDGVEIERHSKRK